MNKKIASLIKNAPTRVSEPRLIALHERMISLQKKCAAKAKDMDSNKPTVKDRREFLKLALEEKDAMFEYMLSGGKNPIKAAKKQTSGSIRSNK